MILLGVIMAAGGAVVVRMVLVLLAALALVMAERHALPRCHRSHALKRNGQDEQRDGEDPEKTVTHSNPIVRQQAI